MAGRGMGAATKGGGCVGSGSRNKMTSKSSSKVEVMMADGGDVKKKGVKEAYPGDKSYPDLKRKGMPKQPSKGEIEYLRGVIKGTSKSLLEPKLAKKVDEIKKTIGAVKPKKKMGGGMMKKYKKGGYASK